MSVSRRTTVLIRYSYDPLDRQTDCILRTLPAIQRFYCKSRLATEIQGSLQTSVFQHDDQLLAQQRQQNGSVDTTLLATDQQRSVLGTRGLSGSHFLAYSPYGHRPAENGLLSLLGFNGERPDPLTGHYHLGNGYRQFNPVLMRFNSPDSWSPFGEGGVNTYGYCGGDPRNEQDPTGHTPLWLKIFLRERGLMAPSRRNALNIEQPNAPTTFNQTQINTRKNNKLTTPDSGIPEEMKKIANQLERARQRHYQNLDRRPESTLGRPRSAVQISDSNVIMQSRKVYSRLGVDYYNGTKPPTPPSRTSTKVFFTDNNTIHEVERLVSPPVGGWKKVSDVRK
jgi:RHS repeat-associated protein